MQYSVADARDKVFLTPTQAAEILGFGRMTIYRYIRDGKIQVTRFDRKTLIAKSDLMAMFNYLPPRDEATTTTKKRISQSPSSIHTLKSGRSLA